MTRVDAEFARFAGEDDEFRLAREDRGFGFASDWMRKDLNIALAEAKKNGAPLPNTALIEQYYGRICSRGHGRWDNTALMDLLAKN